jgi:DNA-binding PadR family transcriptional regulator
MALGEFEQVVLFAIARMKGEAHSAAIIEEIESRADRRVSPGALYTVLERLEAKGMVTSWIGDSTPERGGRRRKVYRLLPEGARELRASYESLRKMASGVLQHLDELAEEGG